MDADRQEWEHRTFIVVRAEQTVEVHALEISFQRSLHRRALCDHLRLQDVEVYCVATLTAHHAIRAAAMAVFIAAQVRHRAVIATYNALLPIRLAAPTTTTIAAATVEAAAREVLAEAAVQVHQAVGHVAEAVIAVDTL